MPGNTRLPCGPCSAGLRAVSSTCARKTHVIKTPAVMLLLLVAALRTRILAWC